MDGVRQGIHFDMDTIALEKYYPKAAWRAAYDDVKGFLGKNGFEHEQGSGYHSVKPMTQADAVIVLGKMLDAYPWLHKCVKICTVADVPATFDVTNLFDKNTAIPERSDMAKAADEPSQSVPPQKPQKKPSLLKRLDEANE